ncbi:MAG: ABC transporter permease [Gammaproteobacteria bacterium]|jgi:putative ABC transport system permease protein
MSNTVQDITVTNLVVGFVPMILVLGFLFKWHLNYKNAIYAIVRMVIQLLIIGYLLIFIFNARSSWIILGILVVMVIASSWIALGVVKKDQVNLLMNTLIAISIGGGITLVVVTQGVLTLDPWYQPRYVIPLAGMIFANSMNTVSLAVERLSSETERGVGYVEARNKAFQASLIPIINSLFAVGLVSLPGMMTGQILSGVSPLVAVRYQIVVMCMIFSSAGLSSALFLILAKKHFTTS